jgi:hypothetical protein
LGWPADLGFTDVTGGLWGWYHRKMSEASRMERRWLTMALAPVWTVSLGCQAEVQAQGHERGTTLPATHSARQRLKRAEGEPSPRCISGAGRGRLVLLAALFQGQEIVPCATLEPEAWPQTLQALRKLPSTSLQRERERRRKHKRQGRARTRAAA